jgi:hypothetical protein
MIHFKVNGKKRTYDGAPEMPLLPAASMGK